MVSIFRNWKIDMQKRRALKKKLKSPRKSGVRKEKKNKKRKEEWREVKAPGTMSLSDYYSIFDARTIAQSHLFEHSYYMAAMAMMC